MRRLGFLTIGLIVVILFLPAVMAAIVTDQTAPIEETVSPMELTETVNAADEGKKQEGTEEDSEIDVQVYRSKKEVIESVPLEAYVTGVVASEMPASYEQEALKAQALSARTVIINQLLNKKDDTEVPEGADVTDTVMHQVYQNKEELQQKWGDDFPAYWEKVRASVQATRNQLLTYEGQPIMAAFFSTSNGYTENAKDYWQNDVPYLRSVESPWDEASPRYAKEVTMPVEAFEQAIGVSLPGNGSVGTIVSRTDSGRVEKVEVNERTFTGREIREMLALDSTDFTWRIRGQDVVIHTKGWGHGVGLSQFGANAMALEGKTYKDIVTHYYTGVTVSEATPFLKQLGAS